MSTAMGMVKTRTLGTMQRKSSGDLRAGAGVTNENLHEFDEFGNEEHESENEESEEGVADNFAGDITVEKAHGRKGECNMGEDEHGGCAGERQRCGRHGGGVRRERARRVGVASSGVEG